MIGAIDKQTGIAKSLLVAGSASTMQVFHLERKEKKEIRHTDSGAAVKEG